MHQAAGQGRKIARDQAVEDIKAGDLGRRGDVRRDAADNGQKAQLIGQDQLQQDADPEPGHRYTGQGEDAGGVIFPVILANSGDDAQGHANQHGQDHRHSD